MASTSIKHTRTTLDDSEFATSPAFRDKISLSRSALSKVISRVCQVNSPDTLESLGIDESVKRANQRLGSDFASALNIVTAYYHILGNGKQSGTSPNGAIVNRQNVTKALKLLNRRFGRHLEITGKVIGKERGHWDVIQTRLGKTTDGEWSFHPTDTLGSRKCITSPGFRIGDIVQYSATLGEKDNYSQVKGRGVITNASSFHDGLRQGTARVQVLDLESGKAYKVTPWSISQKR